MTNTTNSIFARPSDRFVVVFDHAGWGVWHLRFLSEDAARRAAKVLNDGADQIAAHTPIADRQHAARTLLSNAGFMAWDYC